VGFLSDAVGQGVDCHGLDDFLSEGVQSRGLVTICLSEGGEFRQWQV
jgi:hypothetical protein